MNKILYNGQVIIDLDELADKYTKAEVDALVSSVFKYKGTVATKADLNNIVDINIGDCYNVEADGVNYAWNGEEWSALSGTVDLTNYYTKEQVDGKFDSYLPKNNTAEYNPTDDYNPATKKYVDDKIATDYETIKMTSSLIGPNISTADNIKTFELNEVDRANIMNFINKYWDGSTLSRGLALQFGTVLMVLNVSETSNTRITFVSNGVVTKDKPIYYVKLDATFTGSTPGKYVEYYESYHPYWKGYAKWASYLHKENTLSYTPTADYHPATKKYVDDSVNSRNILEGTYNDTDVTAGYDFSVDSINALIDTLNKTPQMIQVNLVREFENRTEANSVMADIGFNSSTSTDGTTIEEVSLHYVVVSQGVYLRFYGSATLTDGHVTSSLHCFSEDYNG